MNWIISIATLWEMGLMKIRKVKYYILEMKCYSSARHALFYTQCNKKANTKHQFFYQSVKLYSIYTNLTNQTVCVCSGSVLVCRIFINNFQYLRTIGCATFQRNMFLITNVF